MLDKYSDLDFGYPYIEIMDIKYIIADNIKRLTKSRGITIAKLGVLSCSSYGNAHRTINPVEDGHNPSTKSLQSIADGLGIPFWMMTIESMPVELFDDADLEEMIRAYAQCSPESRKRISQNIRDIARLDELDRQD